MQQSTPVRLLRVAGVVVFSVSLTVPSFHDELCHSYCHVLGLERPAAALSPHAHVPAPDYTSTHYDRPALASVSTNEMRGQFGWWQFERVGDPPVTFSVTEEVTLPVKPRRS